MSDTRHGLRSKCSEKCMLVLNGTNHECKLENISISGVLIRVSEHMMSIRTGTRCGLHLCGDPQLCPGEYACQITRISTNEIGLKFVRTR